MPKYLFLISSILCTSVFAQAINPSDLMFGEPKTPDAPAISAKQLPPALNESYSGFGNMPIGTALETLLPPGMTYKLEGVDAKAKGNWSVKGGKLFFALDEIALQNSLNWSVNGNEIVFKSEKAFAEPAKTKVTPKEASEKPTKGAKPVKQTEEDSIVKLKKPIVVSKASSADESINKKPTSKQSKELGLDAGEEVVQITPIPSSAVKKIVKFEITGEDDTLFLALRRWSTDAGYQLVWDAGKDFPAKKTVYPTESFEDAITLVMNDTARSSFPLHACSYSNRVVRVLHISQACERQGGA